MSPIDSTLGIDGLVVQSVKHAQHTRQGNELMVLHLAVPKYHCTHCNRYFRHQFPGIRPRLRSTEAYRLEVFEAHDGSVSQRKLTLTHHIGRAPRALVPIVCEAAGFGALGLNVSPGAGYRRTLLQSQAGLCHHTGRSEESQGVRRRTGAL